jgi:hypothetical protein
MEVVRWAHAQIVAALAPTAGPNTGAAARGPGGTRSIDAPQSLALPRPTYFARMKALPKRLVVLALLLAPCMPGAAVAVDLHAYWDDRCKECHDDAGAFARRTLRVEDGRLVGAHHREDLGRFLHQHYLADDLVAPVTAMLIAQATTTPLFKSHCAACHGDAAALARKSLVLKDGVLTGKVSGRPVSDFLRTHGGLAPGEIPAMTATLQRVLGEVGAR